jgi:murein DD-endopeptidase MepM/ murein hydrolase activator NlpD
MRAISALLVFLLSMQVFALDDFDREFIGENTRDLTVFTGATLDNGQEALIPVLKVPGGSLLSVRIENLSLAAEMQKYNPKEANLLVAGSPQDAEPVRSKNGWICNIGILDVNTENVDEDDIEKFYQAKNLCVSLNDFQSLNPSLGNGTLAKEAFLDFQSNSLNTAKLLELAQSIQAQPFQESDESQDESQDAQFSNSAYSTYDGVELFQVGFAKRRLISPLEDCDLKCLQVTSDFGPRSKKIGASSFHWGVDLRTRDEETKRIVTGKPVVSVLKGRVLKQAAQKRRSGKFYGAGKYVVVRHRRAGMATKYFHLSKFVGDYKPESDQAVVEKGQLIAYSGDTGGKKGRVAPHLHFETLVLGREGNYSHKNPVEFLGRLKKVASSSFDNIQKVFQQFFALNQSKNSNQQL